jgi:hypothetical protein
VELAGRSGKEKNGAGRHFAQARRDVGTRGGSVGIRKHVGTHWHESLLEISLWKMVVTACFEELPHCSGGVLILNQFHVQNLRDCLSGNVVTSWP